MSDRAETTPAPKSTLVEGLIARLRTATGPDRNLGDDVLFATGHRYSMAFLSHTGWRWRGADLPERDVPVTSSLEAALALVERVAPGQSVSVITGTPARAAILAQAGSIWGAGHLAPTAPLAVLTALLVALSARVEK